MSKHTPGPWQITREYDECAVIENGDFHDVATIHAGSDHDDNARLIAAAPDLLAAAQNLLECHDDCANAHMQRKAWEALRAAIAAAEGE